MILLRALGADPTFSALQISLPLSELVYFHSFTYSMESARHHASRQMLGPLTRKPCRLTSSISMWFQFGKGCVSSLSMFPTSSEKYNHPPWESRRNNKSPSISNPQGRNYCIITTFFFALSYCWFITKITWANQGVKHIISQRKKDYFFSLTQSPASV